MSDPEWFDVEAILDVKYIEGIELFKVRWKGYGEADDTWEPRSNLETCIDLVEEFIKERETMLNDTSEPSDNQEMALNIVPEVSPSKTNLAEEKVTEVQENKKEDFWKDDLNDTDMFTKVKARRSNQSQLAPPTTPQAKKIREVKPKIKTPPKVQKPRKKRGKRGPKKKAPKKDVPQANLDESLLDQSIADDSLEDSFFDSIDNTNPLVVDWDEFASTSVNNTSLNEKEAALDDSTLEPETNKEEIKEEDCHDSDKNNKVEHLQKTRENIKLLLKKNNRSSLQSPREFSAQDDNIWEVQPATDTSNKTIKTLAASEARSSKIIEEIIILDSPPFSPTKELPPPSIKPSNIIELPMLNKSLSEINLKNTKDESLQPRPQDLPELHETITRDRTSLQTPPFSEQKPPLLPLPPPAPQDKKDFGLKPFDVKEWVAIKENFCASYHVHITWEQLVNAVDRGDITMIHKALGPKHKHPLNTILKDGVTLLHKAVLFRRDDIVETLITRGAFPNIIANGMTPLMIAIDKNAEKCFRILLEFGAFLDILNPNGDTALHIACKNHHTKYVDQLLQKGANFGIRNRQGKLPKDLVNGSIYKTIQEHTTRLSKIVYDLVAKSQKFFTLNSPMIPLQVVSLREGPYYHISFNHVLKKEKPNVLFFLFICPTYPQLDFKNCLNPVETVYLNNVKQTQLTEERGYVFGLSHFENGSNRLKIVSYQNLTKTQDKFLIWAYSVNMIP